MRKDSLTAGAMTALVRVCGLEKKFEASRAVILSYSWRIRYARGTHAGTYCAGFPRRTAHRFAIAAQLCRWHKCEHISFTRQERSA